MATKVYQRQQASHLKDNSDATNFNTKAFRLIMLKRVNIHILIICFILFRGWGWGCSSASMDFLFSLMIEGLQGNFSFLLLFASKSARVVLAVREKPIYYLHIPFDLDRLICPLPMKLQVYPTDFPSIPAALLYLFEASIPSKLIIVKYISH